MVVNTMAYMLVIGLLGLFKQRVQYDKIFSWLMFLALACLFCEYNIQNIEGAVKGFTIFWGHSEIGDITIDFYPKVLTNELIIPLFSLSLLTILNNNIFRYEERKSLFNSYVILNFMFVSLLICAENYMQLIFSVLFADIMEYLILKDVDSSRRYVIYNFFADMCLFMVLSLASGRIQSLDITRLLGYEHIGRHKDLVGMITAIAAFVKLGCFLFQSYLLDVSQTRFHRMITINLLGSPLIGILLVIKLHNLMAITDLFAPIFDLIMLLSFFAGICGFIIKRHLQKKVVYMNMAFISLMLYLLKQNEFAWSYQFSFYYMLLYLMNSLYFQIYVFENKESDVTKMLSIKENNMVALNIILFKISLLISLFAICVLQISQKFASHTAVFGAVLLILAQSMVLNHIYKSDNTATLGTLNTTPKCGLSFVFNAMILLGMLYLNKEYIVSLLIIYIAFLILVTSPLGEKTKKLYGYSILHDRDLSKSFFFYALVYPLTYISRTFWLMVDLFLSEKVITGTISTLRNSSIKLFLRCNKKGLWTPLLFVLLGLAVLVISFYNKGVGL